MADRSARIELSDIPGAGFDVPTYCGCNGKKPVGGTCPRCGKELAQYMQRDHEVPKLYYFAIPFFIVMIPIGILVVSQAISYKSYVPSVGAAAGLIPMFGYLAYVLWAKGNRIKIMGTVQCPSCQREVGSRSKFCVYCGRPVAWLY